MDRLFEAFEAIGLSCAYSHFTEPKEPPYLVYIGNGQDTFGADNTWYYKRNRYQLEYYFKKKDEEQEERIEQILLQNGFNYTKSEDVFIEDEGVFLIYYEI